MNDHETQENQIEDSSSSRTEFTATPETKESDDLRVKAAAYLENSDGKRSFIQTLKSFAAWVAQQLAD